MGVGILQKKETFIAKFNNKWREAARKLSTAFQGGKPPFGDRGQLIFYPPHLILTFAWDAQAVGK